MDQQKTVYKYDTENYKKQFFFSKEKTHLYKFLSWNTTVHSSLKFLTLLNIPFWYVEKGGIYSDENSLEMVWEFVQFSSAFCILGRGGLAELLILNYAVMVNLILQAATEIQQSMTMTSSSDSPSILIWVIEIVIGVNLSRVSRRFDDGDQKRSIT